LKLVGTFSDLTSKVPYLNPRRFPEFYVDPELTHDFLNSYEKSIFICKYE